MDMEIRKLERWNYTAHISREGKKNEFQENDDSIDLQLFYFFIEQLPPHQYILDFPCIRTSTLDTFIGISI